MKHFDKSKADYTLYAVTDSRTGTELERAVRAALEGGITFLQLRNKHLSTAELAKEGKRILGMCRDFNVPLVINDDVNAALECDADGAHVGQSDMTLAETKLLMPPDKIIGVSGSTLEEALAAAANGADYIGSGAVFPTSSKDDAADVPFDVLKKITANSGIPVVAIGGISLANIHLLCGSGIAGIAVISAIFGQDDIRAACKALKEKMRMIK